MPRCSFCKQNYEFPRGLTLALNDGNILYFCSNKCRKNMLKLHRDNKKVNWVRKHELVKKEIQEIQKVKDAEKVRVADAKEAKLAKKTTKKVESSVDSK